MPDLDNLTNRVSELGFQCEECVLASAIFLFLHLFDSGRLWAGPFGRVAMRLLMNLLRDESGPAAVEYVVMLALIILVLMVSIGTLGNTTDKSWDTINAALGNRW